MRLLKYITFGVDNDANENFGTRRRRRRACDSEGNAEQSLQRCYLVFCDMVNGAGEHGFSADWRCYITNGSSKFWYLQHVVFYEAASRNSVHFACKRQTNIITIIYVL